MAQKGKRPIAFWVICVFFIYSMLFLLAGQTTALFNYDFAVRLGLQEPVEEISRYGIEVNRSFGGSDTIIYLPMIVVSLVGLSRGKRWSLLTTSAVMGISAYWAVVVVFMLLFLRGVPSFNLAAGPGYWIIMAIYIIFGVWGILYLVFRGDKLVT